MRANAKKPNKPQVATTSIGWPEKLVTYKDNTGIVQQNV